MKIPFVEIPNFPDKEAASQFDNSVFARNPSWVAFLRRRSPAEGNGAMFEDCCGPSRQVLKLVLRVGAPNFLIHNYFVPLGLRPEVFCLALEDWPAMKQFLREPSWDNATELVIRFGFAKLAAKSGSKTGHSQRNLKTALNERAFQDDNHAARESDSRQYDPPLEIPFLKAPDFENSDSAYFYDEMILCLNPRRKAYLRRCSRRELLPGQYEKVCGPNNELFMLVLRNRSGMRCPGVVKVPKGTYPEEYASMISKEPYGNRYIQEILNMYE
jgi:hypothetical protein